MFIRPPHLWKHPSGAYYARWNDDAGRSRRKSLKTTDKAKAEAALNHLIREAHAGKLQLIRTGQRVMLDDFISEFVEGCASRLEPSTVNKYGNALNRLRENTGNIPIGQITIRHLDRHVTDLRRSVSIPTVNAHIRCLRAAFRKAAEWYPDSFKTPLKIPTEIKHRALDRYLTRDELRAILDKITDSELYDFVLFAVLTGCRSGEILRLTWNDIDDPKGFIRIRSAQKNKEDNRIPLTEQVRAICERAHARCSNNRTELEKVRDVISVGVVRRDRERLFRWQTPQAVWMLFKEAARLAGVPEARVHDLRHTFASYLAMQGETGMAIQRLLRHRQYSSTQRYLHLCPDHLAEVADRLSLGPIPAPPIAKKLK